MDNARKHGTRPIEYIAYSNKLFNNLIRWIHLDFDNNPRHHILRELERRNCREYFCILRFFRRTVITPQLIRYPINSHAITQRLCTARNELPTRKKPPHCARRTKPTFFFPEQKRKRN